MPELPANLKILGVESFPARAPPVFFCLRARLRVKVISCWHSIDSWCNCPATSQAGRKRERVMVYRCLPSDLICTSVPQSLPFVSQPPTPSPQNGAFSLICTFWFWYFSLYLASACRRGGIISCVKNPSLHDQSSVIRN